MMLVSLVLEFNIEKDDCLKKVLIVDDSKFSRKAIRKLLESADLEVVGEAVDGMDGIEKFKSLCPDLILTDIEMPNLDGISMVKEIRSYNNTINIIIISSVVNSQVMSEVVKFNIPIIKKPLKIEKLINAIKLLNKLSEKE